MQYPRVFLAYCLNTICSTPTGKNAFPVNNSSVTSAYKKLFFLFSFTFSYCWYVFEEIKILAIFCYTASEVRRNYIFVKRISLTNISSFSHGSLKNVDHFIYSHGNLLSTKIRNCFSFFPGEKIWHGMLNLQITIQYLKSHKKTTSQFHSKDKKFIDSTAFSTETSVGPYQTSVMKFIFQNRKRPKVVNYFLKIAAS